MKRLSLIAICGLAGCIETTPGLGPSSGGGGGGSAGYTEYMVLGSSMSFDDCRARGGLIIRDNGSPMVACDPHVIRAPVPEDEFNNPTSGT